MRGNSARLSRRHLWAILAATAVVLGLVTSVVLTARSAERSATPASVQAAEGAAPSVASSSAQDGTLEPVARPPAVGTADRDEYVTAISALVFGMDTRTTTAAQHREELRREADPKLSDDGRSDLHATIDARVPTDAMWGRMRSNEQWSQWQPTRTWEPAAWTQVVTSGHVEPGWAMRNVTGVQTIHYVEDGQVRSTSREAMLTVVMRCPAEGVDLQSCRLVLISTQPVF